MTKEEIEALLASTPYKWVPDESVFAASNCYYFCAGNENTIKIHIAKEGNWYWKTNKITWVKTGSFEEALENCERRIKDHFDSLERDLFKVVN